jgi:hypothetical protein
MTTEQAAELILAVKELDKTLLSIFVILILHNVIQGFK